MDDSGEKLQLGLWEQMRKARASLVPPEQVWTVSEVVRKVASALETEFGTVWVEGELSNLKVMPSGHMYFTLKDADAQLNGVMFRSQVRLLKHRPADGQRVRSCGRLTVYPAQGRFQLIADRMEPSGLGDLLAALERLKAKLASEGFFDGERKRTVPGYPACVGVVTSPTGAAVKDILDVLGRRWPARVIISPTSVQGEGAPQEIVDALRRIQQVRDVEVVICGRGGGSAEDLWAFNDEAVVRAIRACRVPVISAVGHEVDVTLADLAADLRAPTPSAAAELAVPEASVVRARVASMRKSIAHNLDGKLSRARANLRRLQLAVEDPRRGILQLRQDLDAAFQKLVESTANLFRQRTRQYTGLSERLAVAHPRARILEQRKRWEIARTRVTAAGVRLVAGRKQRVAVAAGRLAALSPLSVLERGYSLVLDRESTPVRSWRQVEVGDSVDVLVHQGQLRCRVEERGERPADSHPEPEGKKGRVPNT